VGPPCKHDAVQFYAFDILVSEGEDLRNLPLSMRKANLTVIPSFAARVVSFNPLEGWSRDASEDVAHELEQRVAEGYR
jgi:ATP-dependent DNA ligase